MYRSQCRHTYHTIRRVHRISLLHQFSDSSVLSQPKQKNKVCMICGCFDILESNVHFRHNYVSMALIISSFGKMLLILMVIWDYKQLEYSWLVSIIVLASNTEALSGKDITFIETDQALSQLSSLPEYTIFPNSNHHFNWDSWSSLCTVSVSVSHLLQCTTRQCAVLFNKI